MLRRNTRSPLLPFARICGQWLSTHCEWRKAGSEMSLPKKSNNSKQQQQHRMMEPPATLFKVLQPRGQREEGSVDLQRTDPESVQPTLPVPPTKRADSLSPPYTASLEWGWLRSYKLEGKSFKRAPECRSPDSHQGSQQMQESHGRQRFGCLLYGQEGKGIWL